MQPRSRRRQCAPVGLTIPLLVLGLSLAGSSCRRNRSTAPALPRLGTIEVSDVTAARADGAPLDVAALKTLMAATLMGAGIFQSTAADGGATTPPVSGQPVVRVRTNVAVEFTEVESKGVARTGVSIKLDSRPSEVPGAIEDELSAGGEQIYEVGPATDRARLAQRLAERTITDLLGGFVARARLRTATPAEIHAAITADAGVPAGVREEAIRTAGARGLRGEVPVLLQLLQNDSETTRDAALGALIALRERQAVAHLTRNRSLRDRREMRKILDAVAILGGDEARDYLSFVAESHEDEEIRRLAADAKVRLERHDQR